MSDDTNVRGAQDRVRVAGEQDHEVRYFAEKHGISREDAQTLISRYGNSREKLDAAVERMKG